MCLLAGVRPQPDLREVAQLAPARRDHDQTGPVAHHRVLHSQAGHVVAGLQVVGHHQDRLGLGQVGHVGRQHLCAERPPQRSGHLVRHRAAAGVKVVASDDCASQLLEQVVLLVRGEGRSQADDGLRSVLFPDGRQPRCGRLQRLVPGSGG